MQQNFDHALACTLREEGGFTSDPRDKGGPTNLGVTQTTWETYIGQPVDEAAMRALTVDDVRALYRTRYWNKIKGDALPSGLDCALFDFAVNSGPRRASLALQSLLSVKPDGVIGPITLHALGVDMRLINDQPILRENLDPLLRGAPSPSLRGARSATRQSIKPLSERMDCHVGPADLLAMTTKISASPDAGEARGSGAPNISILIAKLSTARLEFLRSLPAFTTFGKGWTARVNRIAVDAARMC